MKEDLERPTCGINSEESELAGQSPAAQAKRLSSDVNQSRFMCELPRPDRQKMTKSKRHGRSRLSRPAKKGTPNNQARSHELLPLIIPSNDEIDLWREFADIHIPDRFSLRLPPVYVEFLVTTLLESIFVRQCAPVRQQEIVGQALLSAAEGYKKLLARAVERGNDELPNTGISKVRFRRMVAQAVYDAVQKCEAALYLAPLGLDLFTDVIWPEAKKLLAVRCEWVAEFKPDGDEPRRWWLKPGTSK